MSTPDSRAREAYNFSPAPLEIQGLRETLGDVLDDPDGPGPYQVALGALAGGALPTRVLLGVGNFREAGGADIPNIVPLTSLRSGTHARLDEGGLALRPLSGVDGNPAVLGSVLAPITAGFGHLTFFGATDDPTRRGLVSRMNGSAAIEAQIRLMAASTSVLAPTDPRNASLVLTSAPLGGVGAALLNANTTINGDLSIRDDASITGDAAVGGNATAFSFIPQYSNEVTIAASTPQSFAHGLGNVPRIVSVLTESAPGQWRPVSGDGTAAIKILWVSTTHIRIDNGSTSPTNFRIRLYR